MNIFSKLLHISIYPSTFPNRHPLKKKKKNKIFPSKQSPAAALDKGVRVNHSPTSHINFLIS